MSARVTVTRARPALQRKTQAAASPDPAEREADRVAARVAVGGAGSPLERVGARPPGPGEPLPAAVGRVVAGAGRPLEPEVRREMGQRFGHDFAQVRVHADPAAGVSAGEVAARAYTVGSSIVFGAGEYAPSTPEGRRLLAHELTHVVQQAAVAEGGPRLQRDGKILGGDGSSGTVELYFYGDLESWDETRLFRSPPGYPRLTDYGQGTSQEDAAKYTGTAIRPSLANKYRLTVDAAYFAAHFRNMGDRSGYSEYGTTKPIPRSYFEKVGTLTAGTAKTQVSPLPPVLPAGDVAPAGKGRGRSGGTVAPLKPPAVTTEGEIDVPEPVPPGPVGGGTGRTSGRGGGGAAVGAAAAGLLAGAWVLAQPLIKRWFAENYLQEKWAKEEREMIAKAIAAQTSKYNALIATDTAKIQAEKAAGRRVVLHVVVDTEFVDTDFGPAMIGAKVTDYSLLYEGDIPIEWPLFQPGRGFWAELFHTARRFYRRSNYDLPL